MATITYQGASSGGNLFQGIKFHILQRVPARQTWLNAIQSNGGEHVKLEKLADIVIADHAKPNLAPPGSISWTFIDQSLKRGELQDHDQHRASPAPKGAVRDVGSAQPTKQGRSHFTEEDDRILMEWCTRAELKGVSLRGNQLYKELEGKNNRHTFQSWRDRWIKYLSMRQRPSLADEDEVDNIMEVPVKLKPGGRATPPAQGDTEIAARKSDSGSIENRTSGESSTIIPQHNSGGRAQEAIPKVSKAARPDSGNQFTEDDIQILMDAYDVIIKCDDDKLPEGWMNVAKLHPNHTAKEWMHYFNNTIKPLKQAEKEVTRATANTIRHESLGTNSKLSSPNQQSLESSDVKSSQVSTGPELSILQTGKSKEPVNSSFSDEQSFKNDLTSLAEWAEVEVEFNPLISGRRIPLFDLWRIVMSQGFGGYDAVNGNKSWSQVARRLNFNFSRHASAATELQACYGELLADYEKMKESYDSLEHDASLTGSQEEAAIEDQFCQDVARVAGIQGDEQLADMAKEGDDRIRHGSHGRSQSFPLQPEAAAERRTSIGHSSYDERSNKRQRIDKGRGKGRVLEIPDSPGNLTSGIEFRTEGSRRSTSDEHERAERSHGQPINAPLNLEPETQDFAFAEDEAPFEDLVSSTPRTRLPIQYESNGETLNSSGDLSSDDSSTQSKTESQEAREINEFVDHCISMQYSQEIVCEALEATTLETENAMIVMESLREGTGIPEDIMGVWTKQDDDVVFQKKSKSDTQVYMRVVNKHGEARCRARRKYLTDLREVKAEAG